MYLCEGFNLDEIAFLFQRQTCCQYGHKSAPRRESGSQGRQGRDSSSMSDFRV